MANIGLPVQVRDAYLSENQRMLVPESEVNKNYYTQEMERNVCWVEIIRNLLCFKFH